MLLRLFNVFYFGRKEALGNRLSDYILSLVFASFFAVICLINKQF
jgi:hypothetical protein